MLRFSVPLEREAFVISGRRGRKLSASGAWLRRQHTRRTTRSRIRVEAQILDVSSSELYFGNTVTKVRASVGANLGTFAVGSEPDAIAFDGANLWVVNSTGSSVIKLRASDGTSLGTFAVGSVHDAIAFDGANIWVANAFTNTVSKL